MTFPLPESLPLYFEVNSTYEPSVESKSFVSSFATGPTVFVLTSPRRTHIATVYSESVQLNLFQSSQIFLILSTEQGNELQCHVFHPIKLAYGTSGPFYYSHSTFAIFLFLHYVFLTLYANTDQLNSFVIYNW